MTIISQLAPNPVMTVRELTVGAVAINLARCPGCWAAVADRAIGGCFVCAAAALDRLKIDDAVGAIPVHLVGGGWNAGGGNLCQCGPASILEWRYLYGGGLLAAVGAR